MDATKEFIKEIDAFLKHHGMTGRHLGSVACNNTAFLLKLREGTSPTLDTVDKIRKFMKAYKPAK
jgi:predicted transcriptional regulator